MIAGVTAVTTMIAPKTLMLQVMKDCTEYETEVSTDSVSFVNLHSRPALYETTVHSVVLSTWTLYKTILRAATANIIAGVTVVTTVIAPKTLMLQVMKDCTA